MKRYKVTPTALLASYQSMREISLFDFPSARLIERVIYLLARTCLSRSRAAPQNPADACSCALAPSLCSDITLVSS